MSWFMAFFPAILVGGMLLAITICGLIVFAGLRLLGGGERSRTGMTPDDRRLVQEIHRQLGRMEKRIEALETILLERIKER
ncbi:MAG: hypothetical protein N3D11_00610 [Candidatus Sumerlaeia bacterium]|nr:hypothetical protein [Candidatus Sumerlaeia bacterium]